MINKASDNFSPEIIVSIFEIIYQFGKCYETQEFSSLEVIEHLSPVINVVKKVP